jgi:hypothetical protein
MLTVEDEIKRAPAKPTRSAGCHPARDSGDSRADPPVGSEPRVASTTRSSRIPIALPECWAPRAQGRERDELRGLSLSAIPSNRRRAT